jgi:GNAT superfamily N-acetyltransferase
VLSPRKRFAYGGIMVGIQTRILDPSSPEISVCAQWRVAEFSDVLGTSIDNEERILRAIAADHSQVVLVATCDGVPAGTCLLVQSEIDPLHAASPWLAGLYVAPEFRRLGVGRALVMAIEEQARLRGVPRLYLYAADSEIPYYQNLNWHVADRVDWKGFPTNLMFREPGV